METTEKTNGKGLAIASFVCGIIAFLVSFLPCISIISAPLAIIAIIFGIIHIVSGLQTNSKIGMSIAGLACGICAFIVMIGWGIAFYKAINDASDNVNNIAVDLSQVVKEIVKDASNNAIHDINGSHIIIDCDSTNLNKFEDMLNELEEHE